MYVKSPGSKLALNNALLACYTRKVEWLYTKALLRQISTTAFLSGSLHLDIILVNWKKIPERALRFVLKDSVSWYDELISKTMVDTFRVSAVKNWPLEVFKILNHISPGYFEIMKIISKEPEILTIFVIIAN